MPDQARGAVGILLDLHDVAERRIGRLVGIEQKIRRQDDGGEHVVEVVGDAAGKERHLLHLLLLDDLVLELALRRRLQRVDDGGFRIALLFLDGGDVEAAEALAIAGKRGIDWGDVAFAAGGLGDGGVERRTIALGNNRADRAAAAFDVQRVMEEPREQRIGAHDAALAVHGRDRHRRMVEKAHEANLGGAQRIVAVVAGAVEDQRARSAGRAVDAESELVEQPNRQRSPAAGLELKIERLGLDFARRRTQRGQQRRAVAGDEVDKLEAAGADLRQILIEPIGKRSVEIDHVTLGIDREKSGRRVIEIVDGVLQFLKDVLLPLTLAGDVAQRPHGHAAVTAAFAERAHAEPQPAGRPAFGPGDAHFFLQALTFARRLEQAVDRLGGVGIADEHALDRPHIVGIRRVDQIEIGGVGVNDAAVAVGDENAIKGVIDEGFDERIGRLGRRQPQDARRERKQREYADRGEHRQKDENIRLGRAASEHDEGGGGGDQHGRDQEHQDNAAGARRAGRAVNRLAGAGGGILGDAVGGRHALFSCPAKRGRGTVRSAVEGASASRRDLSAACPLHHASHGPPPALRAGADKRSCLARRGRAREFTSELARFA